MNTELKKLVEDAAKLLGIDKQFSNKFNWLARSGFNPLDPERGDLMKVAEAAELCIDFEFSIVVLPKAGELFYEDEIEFTKGDYQSLVYAVLRAASVVLKARGE